MSSKHKKWDAQIRDQLQDLRINYCDDQAKVVDNVRHSLKRFGFALLTGLGSGQSRQILAQQLLSISSDLGSVISQSPRNEKIEDVRDFSDVEERDDRGYRSPGELSPHSDPPTLIGLHCIQAAKAGGESYLVNVRTIHDAIEALDPELLKELYHGFPYWRVEGQIGGPGPAPDARAVFTRRDENVSCVYYRPFIEKAVSALGESLTEKQAAALDLFDRFSNEPTFALRFHLVPGDTLFVHNRTVLHARTAYQDWQDTHRRRHLLRVWIDAPNLLPVAAEHELGDIFSNIRT